MTGLSTLLEKIKSGNLEGLLENVKAILATSSGPTESQQLIRHCSRYIYEQPNIPQANFSHIIDIVGVCCEHQHENSVTDPAFHLKSMYYLIIMAAKRKEFHQYLNMLLSDVEPYLNACDSTSGDTHSIVKNMYLSIWNASLVAEVPLQALTLQQYALIFLLATGASITKVCDQAKRILCNYEHVNKSLGNAEKFCVAVINCVTRKLKMTSSFSGNIILAIIHIVLMYAKSLTISGKCSEFSKTTRLLVSVLEEGCDQNTVLALKVGLKLTEVGMALKVGKCQEEMMGKFIQSCRMVPNETLPNNVMLLSLLYTAYIFEDQNKKDIMHTLGPSIMGSIVDNILARCNSSLPEDNAQRVTGVLCQQLVMYADMMKTTQNQNEILKQALPWTLKTSSFISSHFKENSNAVFHIYSVGANSGNLGVLAFKGGSYDLAAQFLEACVEMLLIYSSSLTGDQKASVNLTICKKLVLWSDAVRYSGNYWESAVVACHGMLMGHISVEETAAMWVKCKRDAEKADNTKLRGLTICDVLRGATDKFKSSVNTGFNSFTALQCEIDNYRKQSHDTVEDQLSCGRAVVDCAENVEGKIYGYLVIAEALWLQPSLAAQRDEALQTTKKAISLVAENKGNEKEKCTNRLMELEALSYFWLYLCHLQQIQDVTVAEVQKADKPVSLSVQATDLGEEVQVDDVCDVRPSSTYLTLHAQETSLASLGVALTIWEKLDSKGVTLEDASACFEALASTAYVYQLSGFVIPTVRSWKVLISMASRHSNKMYFIKGVTELLLIVPEFLSFEIVKEAETQIAQCQESETQDSSLMYLSQCFRTAIAYYHLKNGQYKEGGSYLKQALNDELMKKRTIRATETQALVNYVASLYAWLPPWVLGADYKLPQPCISLAMLASRQALAVLKTPVPAANDVICWRHRIAWLHIMTTLWLGNLCWASAQPRLARAYLKQCLNVTQELALPLRTGELLELLARVDLLCDQLDDCLVKVDSLLTLLVVHPSNPQAFTAMSKYSEIFLSEVPKTCKDTPDHPAFQIFSAADNFDEESIRGCSNHDYDLKPVSFDRLIVVGPAERVSSLAVPQAPLSPSLKYRKETSLVQFESCPHEETGCQVCSTPAIHHLRMSAAVLFAYVLAHKGDFWPAKRNLSKFKEMYDAVSQQAPTICNHIMSSVNNGWRKKNMSSLKYFEAKLNLVHLQSLHCQAQLHVLDDDLQEAASTNLQALEYIHSLDCQLLFQDLQFVTIIILQRYALQRALDQKKNESSNTGNCKNEELGECHSDVELIYTTFKTPARPLGKRLNWKSSTQTSHRLPRKSTKLGKKVGDLSSSSDEEEDYGGKDVLKVPGTHTKQYTKSSGRQMSGSSRCQKLTSTHMKKQNLNVAEIEDQMGTLSLDTSSSGNVQEVLNPVSSPDYLALKSSSKGVGNSYASNSKEAKSIGRENKHLSKANTEIKKKVAKNTLVPATPTILIFSDKDSPNSADDVEALEKEELKPTRGRPRKINAEKPSKVDSNKRATSLSKSKTVETSTRIKTRSSRTIR
ncbi:uncharacterized protein LOC135223625 isoform X2 [Macrobrachium nipponense]